MLARAARRVQLFRGAGPIQEQLMKLTRPAGCEDWDEDRYLNERELLQRKIDEIRQETNALQRRLRELDDYET
jgi:hypothetical protein